MEPFRFKKFIINHSQSSMPVGLDAILLATWVTPLDEGRILDVGTGCGIISLICAQRMRSAFITAIDIDKNSVKEANLNFSLSPWHKRLSAEEKDFRMMNSYMGERKWDLIISNPPFFNTGIKNQDSPRLRARHEADLSPLSLIDFSLRNLTSDGCLAMIVPADRKTEISMHIEETGLEITRVCNIVPRPGKKSKRIMLETRHRNVKKLMRHSEEQTLVIDTCEGVPSVEFQSLTKDFYLKF